MAKRIFFGKNTPRSFEESLPFTSDSPYYIRYKTFANEDIAPLHYGTAMEIDLFYNVRGTVTYNNRSMKISGNTLLVFPPNIVHSLTLHQGDGFAYLLQVSFSNLKKVIDIEEIYRTSGQNLADLVGPFNECYSAVKDLLECMVKNDDNPIIRLRALLEIFETLSFYVETRRTDDSSTMPENSNFLKVINWTQEHFQERILLKDIASLLCYSENYFCYWFKKNGGVTYRTYLNSVRINNACILLKNGMSVQDSCYMSGFSDLSYFIQLFKKTLGCTPKEYYRRFR